MYNKYETICVECVQTIYVKVRGASRNFRALQKEYEGYIYIGDVTDFDNDDPAYDDVWFTLRMEVNVVAEWYGIPGGSGEWYCEDELDNDELFEIFDRFEIEYDPRSVVSEIESSDKTDY